MSKIKDRHPPRMMTSKDDYEHDFVDDYINELFTKSKKSKQITKQENTGSNNV